MMLFSAVLCVAFVALAARAETGLPSCRSALLYHGAMFSDNNQTLLNAELSNSLSGSSVHTAAFAGQTGSGKSTREKVFLQILLGDAARSINLTHRGFGNRVGTGTAETLNARAVLVQVSDCVLDRVAKIEPVLFASLRKLKEGRLLLVDSPGFNAANADADAEKDLNAQMVALLGITDVVLVAVSGFQQDSLASYRRVATLVRYRDALAQCGTAPRSNVTLFASAKDASTDLDVLASHWAEKNIGKGHTCNGTSFFETMAIDGALGGHESPAHVTLLGNADDNDRAYFNHMDKKVVEVPLTPLLRAMALEFSAMVDVMASHEPTNVTKGLRAAGVLTSLNILPSPEESVFKLAGKLDEATRDRIATYISANSGGAYSCDLEKQTACIASQVYGDESAQSQLQTDLSLAAASWEIQPWPETCVCEQPVRQTAKCRAPCPDAGIFVPDTYCKWKGEPVLATKTCPPCPTERYCSSHILGFCTNHKRKKVPGATVTLP